MPFVAAVIVFMYKIAFVPVLFIVISPDVVIAPAFHVPAVTVPTVAMSVPTNLDAAIDPANIALVTFSAPMVVVIDVAPDPDTSPDNVIVSFPDNFELNVVQSAAVNNPG